MSVFTHVKNKKVGSNTFDLSHDKKMSLNMGELVPVLAMECVPGDSINISTSQMLRFAPLIAPIMHQVNVYVHGYFVPNRILWPNWEKFITGGENGEDTTVFPYIDISTWVVKESQVGDYLGLPTNKYLNQVSALPIAAYNRIYNEYYRDQNLIDPVVDDVIDGNNGSRFSGQSYNAPCKKRAWQHDYFTSALPWTQKGPQATIPLGESAPIYFDVPAISPDRKQPFRDAVTGAVAPSGITDLLSYNGKMRFDETGSPDPKNTDVIVDNSNYLRTDLSQADATDINSLRRAFKLQEWLEKNARGGSRYIESILSHFGVRSSDARLQRPEFLGGSTSPVTISEVLQTSDASAGETPQGNMAGHGISVGSSKGIRHYCEEHGYIMILLSVMPKTAYFQGIPKHFTKFDKFQYYWPSFAHLGEQPIENKELYVTGNDPVDEETFGYTPRYAEYKFMLSTVHGEFRNTLDFWHMARKFDNLPLLNKEFIEATPTDRIFAVLDAEKLYIHVYHRIKARRKMPYYGTPTI